jgi:hypothetical protein
VSGFLTSRAIRLATSRHAAIRSTFLNIRNVVKNRDYTHWLTGIA